MFLKDADIDILFSFFVFSVIVFVYLQPSSFLVKISCNIKL